MVYKGRKKSTIIYYAVKSVDKREKARVLQEVTPMMCSLSALQGQLLCRLRYKNQKLAATVFLYIVVVSDHSAHSVQVRALHALKHPNVLRFFSW